MLRQPGANRSKTKDKEEALRQLVKDESMHSHVSIDYCPSLGDWKTAWNFIHFEGFLGTKMTMQFTWQGCDSLLAAPLALDLVRLTEREHRRGKSGVMSHLAAFFKSPMGANEPEFAKQFIALERWADEVASEA